MRIFVQSGKPSGWVPPCPEHGRRQMMLQPNVRYHGPS
jgi:hypothetical protein